METILVFQYKETELLGNGTDPNHVGSMYKFLTMQTPVSRHMLGREVYPSVLNYMLNETPEQSVTLNSSNDPAVLLNTAWNVDIGFRNTAGHYKTDVKNQYDIPTKSNTGINCFYRQIPLGLISVDETLKLSSLQNITITLCYRTPTNVPHPELIYLTANLKDYMNGDI